MNDACSCKRLFNKHAGLGVGKLEELEIRMNLNPVCSLVSNAFMKKKVDTLGPSAYQNALGYTSYR